MFAKAKGHRSIGHEEDEEEAQDNLVKSPERGRKKR